MRIIVGLLANDDPAALKYAEWTGRACRADGLRYELRRIDDPINVEQALRDANNDVRVHGVIVYYPIFGAVPSYSGASRDDYLRDTVSHEVVRNRKIVDGVIYSDVVSNITLFFFYQDVEGLGHYYRSNLYQNIRYVDTPRCEKKCVLPCTALSVIKILESIEQAYDNSKPIGKRMEGKVVTVVNRSEIVGRPLAAMLANDGANVLSVDVESIYCFEGGSGRLRKCSEEDENLEACIRKSDIVITGVPVKGYRIPIEWIKPGSVVVNVASFKNVDETELLKIPGVVYVPTVGKVTVAMLERNLMRLFENFHHPDIRERKLGYDTTKVAAHKDVDNPWYGSLIQLYTAVAVTSLVALTVMKR